MRLVSFAPPDGGAPRAGALLADLVVDLAAAAPLVIEDAADLRWDLLSLLRADQPEVTLDLAADIVAAAAQLLGGDLGGAELAALLAADLGSLSLGGAAMLLPSDQLRLLAPLPQPAALRDFDTFADHAAARARRSGRPLPASWGRRPGFAFANHGAVLGPDAPLRLPQAAALDLGLALACVIGRAGRDIDAADAADYIAGYTLLNAWAARDPAGEPDRPRDIATSIGPWLATPDELELYLDDDGRLSLTLRATLNGRELVRASAAAMHFSFAELIAYASRDVELVPGDILSSGVVAGGCLLDQSDGYGPWLADGDEVVLEATGLGQLRTPIVG